MHTYIHAYNICIHTQHMYKYLLLHAHTDPTIKATMIITTNTTAITMMIIEPGELNMCICSYKFLHVEVYS